MDEFHELYKQISALTILSSLAFKRAPDLEEHTNAAETTDVGDLHGGPPSFEELNVGDEDETDFEDEVATDNAEAAHVALKRRALDRLAEVLARFKAGGNARARDKSKNLDAKHVTSVAMVEDPSHERVVIFCSKNEGVDGDDRAFLEKLSELLRNISGKGETSEEDVDSVFDIIFNHQSPRVQCYSAIIRDAFNQAARITPPKTLTQDAIDRLHHLPPRGRRWEDDHGIQFDFASGCKEESAASNGPIDCPSSGEVEVPVTEVFHEMESLFGTTGSKSVDSTRTKSLLKRVYTVVRDLNRRPVLKTFLRRALHSDAKLFRRVWDALLFLTRIYYGAVTMVDVASKFKSFGRVEFVPVPAKTFTTEKRTRSHGDDPLATLAALECLPRNPQWVQFFGDKNIINEYSKRLRAKKTVHAEVQMICYLKTRSRNSGQPADKVFPYIGCSRRCCFFCESFRALHGKFSARGTHETVFLKWALPQQLAVPGDLAWSIALMRRFSTLLKTILRAVFDEACPIPHRDLIRQSSAALSTAKAVQREEPFYSERPSEMSKLMVGHFAAEWQVEFVPRPDKPGYATFMAPGMPHVERTLPIEQAERYKINHDREKYSLESIEESPRVRDLDRKLCRLCHSPTKSRCSTCWTWYCSTGCQRKDWSKHVFTCRLPNRPNAVDYLRLMVRQVQAAKVSGDAEKMHNSLIQLFADDQTCRAFGFNNCYSAMEALDLCSIYNVIFSISVFPMKALYASLQSGQLSNFLQWVCQLCVEQVAGLSENNCLSWFLGLRGTERSPIPDPDKETYEIWNVAFSEAIDCLGLAGRMESRQKLNLAERDVFMLFVAIQPSLFQLPDIYSQTWIKFGFCYCKSFQHRQELASKYLDLASSNATFDDIVVAYETSTIAELMTTQGIDISNLTRHGIGLHKPPPHEYVVFRLMTGVQHALSGRFCNCFQVREGRACHTYFETHLDYEADTNYGFHLTTSWERWQLLNFYRYLFTLPGFDPRAMAEAKENQEPGSLERYLDSLVPNMRKKLLGEPRAGCALFPRLRGRLSGTTEDGRSISYYHLPCECKVHDVVGPPGICHLSPDQILDRFLDTSSHDDVPQQE